MTTIVIPASIEEATSHLTGIERLLTAKQWERAAIVYAFVRVGTSPASPANDSRLTTRDFAALGIAGLRSDSIVLGYWRAWRTAIDLGHAAPVKAGDEVILPELTWEPLRPRIERDQQLLRRVADREPEQIAEVVKLPEVAHEVAKDDDATMQVTWERKEQAEQQRPQRVDRSKEPHDAEKAAQRAFVEMGRMAVAVQRQKPRAAQQKSLNVLLGQIMHLAAMGQAGASKWTNEDEAFLAEVTSS